MTYLRTEKNYFESSLILSVSSINILSTHSSTHISFLYISFRDISFRDVFLLESYLRLLSFLKLFLLSGNTLFSTFSSFLSTFRLINLIFGFCFPYSPSVLFLGKGILFLDTYIDWGTTFIFFLNISMYSFSLFGLKFSYPLKGSLLSLYASCLLQLKFNLLTKYSKLHTFS